MKKVLIYCTLLLTLLTVTGSAWALSGDGLTVKTSDTERTFVIADIHEITFNDNGLDISLNNGESIAILGNWEITFGNANGLEVLIADIDTPVCVYDTHGTLLRQADTLSQISISDLGPGVYIITCNGKNIKIKR